MSLDAATIRSILAPQVTSPLMLIGAFVCAFMLPITATVRPVIEHLEHNSLVDGLQGVDEILNTLNNIMHSMPPEPDSELAPESAPSMVTHIPPSAKA